MFSNAAVAATAVVLGMSMSLAVEHNDVSTRYFVGLFNLQEFPLAIDQCNPFDIFGQLYQKATCMDDTNLEWQWYTASDCASGTEFDTGYDTFNSSNQNGYGFFSDFDCSATTDSYTTVAFSLTACEETAVTFVEMNGALGTCAYVGAYNADPIADRVSIELYCPDDELVELQYYDASTVETATCTDEYLTSVANTTDECGYMLTTETEEGDKLVYGYITQCVIDREVSASAEDVDSAAKLSMTGLLLVSVIAAFRL